MLNDVTVKFKMYLSIIDFLFEMNAHQAVSNQDCWQRNEYFQYYRASRQALLTISQTAHSRSLALENPVVNSFDLSPRNTSFDVLLPWWPSPS